MQHFSQIAPRVCTSVLFIKEGVIFTTFEEARKILNELKDRYNHPLRVFNSQSFKEANQRRLKAKNPCEPIDEKSKYAYYGVKCVHSGNPRQRSKGVRPNQSHFAMGCPAKITIVYDRITKVLVARECNLEHNHHIGSEIMLHYPSSRRLSKEQRQEMHALLKLRPSNKHLKEHIRKRFGTFTTLKDIQNIKNESA